MEPVCSHLTFDLCLYEHCALQGVTPPQTDERVLAELIQSQFSQLSPADDVTIDDGKFCCCEANNNIIMYRHNLEHQCRDQ